MNIEPKMAIACRNKVEVKIALMMLERANIRWSHNVKATEISFANSLKEARLYIMPFDDGHNNNYLTYTDHPDDCEDDINDPFEWTYVEASDIFKNQIISERRKNATAT